MTQLLGGRLRPARSAIAAIAATAAALLAACDIGLPDSSTSTAGLNEGSATPSASATASATPQPSAVPSATPAFSFEPGAVLGLMPLDRAAFAYEVPGFVAPPLDGDGLRAEAVAPGPGGWVAGGGYSANYNNDSGPQPTEDAVGWFSPDGRDWRRVDSPEVFGGDGYQIVRRIVADAAGWWAFTDSWTGPTGDTRLTRLLLRSENGIDWRRVTPEANVQTIARSIPASSTGLADGFRAAGRVDGELSFFRMDASGHVLEPVALPIPSWVERPRMVEAIDATFGPDGWVILGHEFVLSHGELEPRAIAWRSATGEAWKPFSRAATEALAELYPRRIVATAHGWFSVGQWLYRSTDLASWEPVLEICCGNFVWDVVTHGDLLVALSNEDVRVWASTDGIEWSPVALTDPMFADDQLSSGAIPYAGASNGTDLIFVGSNWPGAAAWLGVTP